MNMAFIAISRRGMATCLKLLEHYPDAVLFAKSTLKKYHYHQHNKKLHFFSCSLSEQVETLFGQYGALVFFSAVGIAVRVIAGRLKSKQTDPAVIAIDDGCRFAVSLLSGHKGGANLLASQIAIKINATPVITTASDSLGKLSVDMLGKEFGWTAHGDGNFTKTASAIVNDAKVAVFLDDGISLPESAKYENLVFVSSITDVLSSDYQGALIVSDRLVSEKVEKKATIYFPKRLVIGIGCNRGTGAEEIEQVTRKVLSSNGYTEQGVGVIASIDLKKDEKGLLEFAKNRQLDISFFEKEEIKKVLQPGSSIVEKHIGVGGVCEPCAILAAGGNITSLLIAKVKSGNVTVAVARKPA